MATNTVSNMSLLGGDPVLDFVNTVHARRDNWGPDYLITFEDLLDFANRVGIIDDVQFCQARSLCMSAPTEGHLALARAKALREAIYRLCMFEAEGMVMGAPVKLLETEIKRAQRKRNLLVTGNYLKWAWRDPIDLDLVTNRLALRAADLLVDRGARRLIKECPGPNCGWLFLDTSRGGRRRWCSDPICGTSARVRRFRAT